MKEKRCKLVVLMGCLRLTYDDYLPTLKVAKALFLSEEKTDAGSYLYGFNGMEKDDEIKGSGNSYDFGARMYDSRLGRWLSIDGNQSRYPFVSPYNFCINNPLLYQDFDGNDFKAKTEEGQKITLKLVELMFGTTEGFTFNKRGKLQYDQDAFENSLKDKGISLKDEQKYMLNTLTNEVINDNKVKLKLKIKTHRLTKNKPDDTPFYTEWNYNKSYNNKRKNRGTIHFNADVNFSLFYDLDYKNGNIKEVEKKVGETTGDKFDKMVNKEVFQADVLIHEIGHYLSWKKGSDWDNGTGQTQNNQEAVGFENIFRIIIGIDQRSGTKHGGGGVNSGSKKPAGAPFGGCSTGCNHNHNNKEDEKID